MKELSLYLEGYQRRIKATSEVSTVSAWLNAKLSRSKRLPSLSRLLRFKNEPTVLSPEQARKEKERHEKLVARLAPDAKGTEADLLKFIERQEALYREKHKDRLIQQQKADEEV